MFDKDTLKKEMPFNQENTKKGFLMAAFRERNGVKCQIFS
jgi:hypothetical protein